MALSYRLVDHLLDHQITPDWIHFVTGHVQKLVHFFDNSVMPCLGLGIIEHSSFAAVDLQLHIIHYHLRLVIYPLFFSFFSCHLLPSHPPFHDFFFSTLLLYHHHHSKQYYQGLYVITSGQNIIFHSLWASYKRKIFRFQS